MKEKHTGKPFKGKTDWARIDALTDEEIEAAVASDPDAALLEDFDWENARVVYPNSKKAISFRVDRDILDWFRKSGRGYQTRMNAVLRAYVEAQRK